MSRRLSQNASSMQSHKILAPPQSMKASYSVQRVAVDIVGSSPQTTKGNLYVLVGADYFTRWVEAYAIPNQLPATEEPAERGYVKKKKKWCQSCPSLVPVVI